MRIELSEYVADVVRKWLDTGTFEDAQHVVEYAVLTMRDEMDDFEPGEIERLMEEAHRSVEERGWVPFEETIAKARALIERHEAAQRQSTSGAS